jgi:hypothetical protein
MSSVLRKMMVVVGANISEFVGGMDKVDKRLLSQSRQLERMGKDMTVGITLPLLAVGIAALKSATEYEAASAIIRHQTGATGDTLVGLNQQFRNLFVSIPNSSKDTASALGMLQTRTGLVGQALEDLTRQHLNLSRITGEAVLPLIEQTTRVFGDWGIATDKQGAAMDYLYKVSQQTGVGVSRLGALVVQYGAPVRQMGFSFEEAAAMLGKFEKEGVNTELVMGSLRIALGKMAQEGITDTSEALRIVTQQIKEAGSTGEANALALETFGARAGPDMAAAIREGRFDLDALLKSLRESPETIAKAAAETLTFSDKLALLRNKAIDAAQPLGNILLKALEGALPALDAVAKGARAVGERFAALPPPVADFVVGLGIAVAGIGPAIIGVAKFQQALVGLKTALDFLSTHPLVLLAMAAVTIGTMIVRENQRVKEAVDARAAEIEARIGAQIAEEKRLALESVETEKKAAQDKIAAASATTRAKLEGLEEEKAAHKAALEDRKREIEDEHKAAIDGIRKEYGYVEDFHESKTDAARRASQAVIDSLDSEVRKATDVYNERMRQIAEQYDAQLQLLDAETREALKAVQDQIDGIDAQTRAEEKALREQQDQRRISELQARIATEEDADRRAELQQQLSDLLADIQRRQLLEARDAEKASLREQMDAIRADAEERKAKLLEQRKEKEEHEKELLRLETQRIEDAKKAENEALAETIRVIQEERKEKEAAENAKYLAAKESNEKQLKGLDGYYVAYKAKLEREVIAKEAAERDKLQATLDRLKDEEKAINASFAEREREAAANAAAKAKAEIVTIPAAAAAATTQFYTKAGTLPGDIAPPVWEGVPFYGDEFATGGTVPGPLGARRMAIVEGGEQVLTPAQQAQRDGGDVHLHYHGPVYGAFDFERSVKEIVRGAVRSGAFRGVIPEVR